MVGASSTMRFDAIGLVVRESGQLPHNIRPSEHPFGEFIVCRSLGSGLLRRSGGRQRDLDEADFRSLMVRGASLAVLLNGLFFEFGLGLELAGISA
jgi:hypothetical protein